MAELKNVFFLAGCLLLLVSCGQNDRKDPDVSHIDISLPLERLEEQLFACRSEAEVAGFLEKNPAVAVLYFPDTDPGQLPAKLYQNISNPGLVAFKSQIDSIFSNADQTVRKPLEDAFRHLKYYYPDVRVPRVQTMVTGFLGRDLLISDSLIIVGLDYFGGPGARYRPDVHHYQLRPYEQHFIAPSIMFFIAQQYNRINPDDRTLLADMVWYGKNFEFTRRMMPLAPDSLILGFSQENLDKAEVSQKDIWAHLTSNKLLYEQTEQKRQKYVGERPLTFEIGEDVPGGIGRWVGWKIVDRLFQQHPEQTLQQIMSNDNAKKILEESGYKGLPD